MTSQRNDTSAVVEELEDQLDAALAMLARIETVNDEFVPATVVDRLSAGEPPLRVWREHRGLDIAALAQASSVDPALVAAIEQGVEPGLRAAAALARVLRIDAEDLLPWRQD